MPLVLLDQQVSLDQLVVLALLPTQVPLVPLDIRVQAVLLALLPTQVLPVPQAYRVPRVPLALP